MEKKITLLLLFFCIHFVCLGQKNDIVYELPVPTVEKIDSLLGHRRPTFAGMSFTNADTLLIWFSFEDRKRLIPEYRRILRKTKRFLKIKKDYFPLFFVFDGIFYPKRRYNHTFRLFSTLDIYIDLEGNFIKSEDWDIGKADE